MINKLKHKIKEFFVIVWTIRILLYMFIVLPLLTVYMIFYSGYVSLWINQTILLIFTVLFIESILYTLFSTFMRRFG